MRRAVAIMLLMLVATACGEAPETPEERGRAVAETQGCFSCHSTGTSSTVAPSWRGLYLSEVELEDGTRLSADESYLRESMLDPTAKTVKGYPKGLMETVIKPGSLTQEEVEALVAYIKSLK